MLKRNRAEWDRITRRIAKCQRRIRAGYVTPHPGVAETEPARLLRLLDSLFIEPAHESLPGAVAVRARSAQES